MSTRTFSAVGATALLALAGGVSMTDNQSGRLEGLMGFRVTGSTLHFQVETGGCTKAEDFRLDVNSVGEGTQQVTIALHRMRIDSCKGFFPEGTEITFETSVVGIKPGQSIVVRNPFGAQGR